MRKGVLLGIAVSVTVILIVIGYIQFGTQVDRDDVYVKIPIVMTAEEHNNDIPIDEDWSDGYSLLYNTLENGDLLIIEDVINDIFYDSDEDVTIIIFRWIINDVSDYLDLTFEGDLTDSFEIGDKVSISVTIKYVTLSYKEFNFKMEIYKEQWVSEEYFRNDVDSGGDGFKPLSESSIAKL
jgi:hypothetical protein